MVQRTGISFPARDVSGTIAASGTILAPIDTEILIALLPNCSAFSAVHVLVVIVCATALPMSAVARASHPRSAGAIGEVIVLSEGSASGCALTLTALGRRC